MSQDADRSSAILGTSILLLNAGSIKNKLDELFCIMDSMNPTPHIIGITETWLNQNITDSELCYNSDYCVFRNDRSCKGGGGVCLIIHKSLDPSPACNSILLIV